MLASPCALGRSEVAKNLHTPVVGIDHHHAIMAIDPQAGGQLELTKAAAPLPEVVEQLALLIEDLYHAANRFDHIDVAFGIHPDSLRAEHFSLLVPDAPDGIAKTSRTVEHLHAEIHGVDHDQVVAHQAEFRGVVEFDLACPRLADRPDHIALEVEHENLVAQGVGDIDPLRPRVDRDPCRALEVAFPAFQAADRPLEFSAGLENEDLARLGIGHVNMVRSIDGDALRCDQAVVVSVAVNELVLLLGKIEDVDARRSRIGHDDASAGVGYDFIWADQRMKVGRAGHKV